MNTNDDMQTMLDACQQYESACEYSKAIDTLDKLLSDYSTRISVRTLQEKRSVLLCKIGRYEEAKEIFQGFIIEGRRLGFPIASTTWMYHWLLCKYDGNDKRAMNDFVMLDESSACALIDNES